MTEEHKRRWIYCFIAILIALLAYSVAQTAQDTKLDVPIDPCLTTQYLSNPNGTNTTCNSIPFNAATTFYLHNDSNGFDYNSKVMNATLNLSSGFSYTNVTSLATGNVLVQNWTSPALNVLSIPTGVHLVHVHATKTGGNVNRVIKLFYECGSVNSTGGNLSIRATSELSEALIENTVTEVDMDMLMPAESFNLTDRMIIRVWANSTGGGANPNIQLLFDDNTDSRLALPTTAVDTSNFVTYIGATQDVNLGTHNLTANEVTINTLSLNNPSQGNIYIDSSLQDQTGDLNIFSKLGQIVIELTDDVGLGFSELFMRSSYISGSHITFAEFTLYTDDIIGKVQARAFTQISFLAGNNSNVAIEMESNGTDFVNISVQNTTIPSNSTYSMTKQDHAFYVNDTELERINSTGVYFDRLINANGGINTTLINVTSPVYFEYTNTSNSPTLPNGVFWVINTTNKITDTHNAFNGTAFIAPVSGWYHFQMNIRLTGMLDTEFNDVAIYKNGVLQSFYYGGGQSGTLTIDSGTALLYLNKSDYVTNEVFVTSNTAQIFGSAVPYTSFKGIKIA